MLLNGITVNTTIYISAFIVFQEDNNIDQIVFSIKYATIFTILFVIFTIYAQNDISYTKLYKY